MGFRVAFGSGKCNDYVTHPDESVRELCACVTRKLEQLSLLSGEQLAALPDVDSQAITLRSTQAVLTVFRDPTEEGQEVVVVQGFLPTWRAVRYVGPAGIGLMLAEGLLLSSAAVRRAPDDVLWGYR